MSNRALPFRPPRRGTHESKPRTSAESLREIVDSATRFLSNHPFRDLTVEKLMADTALSRSAFYHYFHDLHHLMETLLAGFDKALSEMVNPWIRGEDDRESSLRESLRGMLKIGAEYGPVLRAIADASPHDERLERAWTAILAEWDELVTIRIEADQRAGLIPMFDARHMARVLNRLDAAVIIDSFGHRQPMNPEIVLASLFRIWWNSLYSPAQKEAGRTIRIRHRMPKKAGKA